MEVILHFHKQEVLIELETFSNWRSTFILIDKTYTNLRLILSALNFVTDQIFIVCDLALIYTVTSINDSFRTEMYILWQNPQLSCGTNDNSVNVTTNFLKN